MAQKPWGIYVPGYPASNMNAVETVARAVGAKPNYVMWYKHWQPTGAVFYNTFNAADFTQVFAYGATPVLTWMPDDQMLEYNKTGQVTHAAILAGHFDAFIDSWAHGMKALGQTVLIRLAHEMNGAWYAYSPGINGNTANSYIAMWRYIWQRFQHAGVTNVQWVFCPNVEFSGVPFSFGQLYPGDEYVDLVALDGYNKGDSVPGHSWQTYQQVFHRSIADLVQLAPNKPFLIAEIGCAEEPGKDKAAWIRDALGVQIPSDVRVKGFIWFDWYEQPNGTGPNYRIDSSPQSMNAFAASL